MLKEIKRQFSEVISYSQNIPDPQIDDLFDRWLAGKRDFIEAFDGKLIYEVGKVTFHFDETTKKDRFEKFINDVYELTDDYTFYQFLKLNENSFYSNLVDAPWKTHDGKIIPKGMKLSKSFKFFEKNSRHLEEIQNMASRIMQENKVEGTLCFSVHPLDFLSSSENTYNWRSCHALDGEYRAGNLSYMVDNTTVMCYLKGADGVKLPSFPESVPWNSKKWRVLLYLSDKWDVIFAGKQYPFGSDAGLDMVKDYFLKVIKKDPYSFCDWISPVMGEVKDSRGNIYDLKHYYIWMRGELRELNNVVRDKDGDRAIHFNDVLRSSVYMPYYTAENNHDWLRQYDSEIVVGGRCNCLRCGKYRIDNPETMQCDDCELEYGTEENDVYGHCDCCDCRIVLDDAYSVGWDRVCEHCYEEYCFDCDVCGETFYKTERHYDEITEKDVCYECLLNLQNDRRGEH